METQKAQAQGAPLSKQRLAHSVMDVITMAYRQDAHLCQECLLLTDITYRPAAAGDHSVPFRGFIRLTMSLLMV